MRSLARMAKNKLALVAFRVVGSTNRQSHATVRISRCSRDPLQDLAKEYPGL